MKTKLLESPLAESLAYSLSWTKCNRAFELVLGETSQELLDTL